MPSIQKTTDGPLLALRNFSVRFSIGRGQYVYAVNNISFALSRGESVGIVGESGSGKSQMLMTALGLGAKNAVTSGEVFFEKKPFVSLSYDKLRRYLGKEIGFVFQDPITTLNPYLTIGKQLKEVLVYHNEDGLTSAKRRERIFKVMQHVQIGEPERRLAMYPHEFSGGMRQRIVIAMAILGRPSLLVADEPTTALDVTTQSSIMLLLQSLAKLYGMSLIMVSHDIALIANVCQRIGVMYAGRMIEYGPTEAILKNPQHPYTIGLIRSVTSLIHRDETLYYIAGDRLSLRRRINHCPFYDRCVLRKAACKQGIPPETKISEDHVTHCFMAQSEELKNFARESRKRPEAGSS